VYPVSSVRTARIYGEPERCIRLVALEQLGFWGGNKTCIWSVPLEQLGFLRNQNARSVSSIRTVRIFEEPERVFGQFH
jgi:hypothetical protein